MSRAHLWVPFFGNPNRHRGEPLEITQTNKLVIKKFGVCHRSRNALRSNRAIEKANSSIIHAAVRTKLPYTKNAPTT